MTQSKYIRDLLHKTNMAEAHSISSPMVSNCKLSRHGADAFHNPSLYRSMVGALQYATLTRPEISFVVNEVCQFMAAPLDSHWTVVKRILRYLKGTLSHCYFSPPILQSPWTFEHSVMLTRHLMWMIGAQPQELPSFLVQIWYLGGLANKKLC